MKSLSSWVSCKYWPNVALSHSTDFTFQQLREQRVTLILISMMIGCSVFMTPILTYIPMPVLFGVFLFMGTSPLADMQFYDRILIIFMPAKYQPDHVYLRKVRHWLELAPLNGALTACLKRSRSRSAEFTCSLSSSSPVSCSCGSLKKSTLFPSLSR